MEFNPDLVSVVIPTKNRIELLSRTLLAIKNQDYSPLEIIISNDGSDTTTREKINALQSDQIKVIHSIKSNGVAVARNRGIEASTGQWVAFCDDDDYWLPNKITSQMEFMKNNSKLWCCTQVLHVDSDMHPVFFHEGENVENYSKIFFENTITGGGSSVIVERELLNTAGWFDTNYSMFADWELWTRLSLLSKPGLVPIIGVLYLEHRNAMSMNQRVTFNELATYRETYATQRINARKLNKFSGLEPIDEWMLSKLLKSGDYLQSIRLVLDTDRCVTIKHRLKYLYKILRFCLTNKNTRKSSLSRQDFSQVLSHVSPVRGQTHIQQ